MKTIAFLICFSVCQIPFVYAFERSGIYDCDVSALACTSGDNSIDEFFLSIVDIESSNTKEIFYFTNRQRQSNEIVSQRRLASNKRYVDKISSRISFGTIVGYKNKSEKFTIFSENKIADKTSIYSYIEKIRNICQSKANCFLYVHGIRNTFQSAIDDAMRISDALEEHTGSSFLPIVYMWPSTKDFDYAKAKEISDASSARLTSIKRIFAELGLSNFSIVAHSRGADVVWDSMSQSDPDVLEDLPTSLVMINPNISSVQFESKLSNVSLKFKKAIQIYINENDIAIWFSNQINELGNLDGSTGFPGVDIVTTREIIGLTSHDIPIESEAFVNDMIRVIIKRLRAASDSSLKRQSNGVFTYED